MLVIWNRGVRLATLGQSGENILMTSQRGWQVLFYESNFTCANFVLLPEGMAVYLFICSFHASILESVKGRSPRSFLVKCLFAKKKKENINSQLNHWTCDVTVWRAGTRQLLAGVQSDKTSRSWGVFNSTGVFLCFWVTFVN